MNLYQISYWSIRLAAVAKTIDRLTTEKCVLDSNLEKNFNFKSCATFYCPLTVLHQNENPTNG